MPKPKLTKRKTGGSTLAITRDVQPEPGQQAALGRDETAQSQPRRVPVADAPYFPRLNRAAASTKAIELIRDMILRGELRPHQALPPERQLAAHLGVSRPTLREAIRALITLNILRSLHGGGTFVTSLNPNLLAEPFDFVLSLTDAPALAVYEARCIIEASIVALAAERITSSEMEALDELIERANDGIGDLDTFLALDVALHAALAHASHNPVLVSLSASLGRLSVESRKLGSRNRRLRLENLNQHRAIVEAITARDPERAREAMLRHLGV